MKRRLKAFYWLMALACSLCMAACNNKAVIDQNTEVSNQNWTYLNKFRFDAKIDNEKIPYNLYINLRVTGNYKYSNMFILVTQMGPDKKAGTKRYELTLANKDGEWLGDGSGNLYSFQLPLKSAYKFPAKGVYTFFIEQNMRDNPLREVSDVGLRVEKATQ